MGTGVSPAPAAAGHSPGDPRSLTVPVGDLARSSAVGGAVTIAAQGLSFALNLTATIVLARLLAPRDFGLVGMVTAVTGFALTFRDLGLSLATVQRDTITHEQVSVLFWVNVAAGVALGALIALSAPLLAAFYQEPRLTALTIALAFVFIPAGISVQPRALLMRQMRFRALAAVDLVALVVGVVLAVLAARLGAGVAALVLLQLAVAVVSAAGLWLVCPWRPGAPRRGTNVRPLLRFGRDVSSFNVTNYIARNIDDVLIGRFWGAAQLGLYSRAYQLMTLPIQMLTAPLGTVAIPLLSRLVDAPAAYRRTYLRLLEKILLLTMPAVMIAILTADLLITVVLGPQWTDAARIFAWLGIAALVQPLGNSTGWLFVSQGRTRELHWWGVTGSVIIVASIVAGLPWGPVGVAMTYALAGLAVRTPLLIWYTGRTGPVGAADLWRALILPSTAAVTVFAAVRIARGLAAQQAPLAQLAYAAAAGVVAGCVVLVALPAGRRALRDVRDLISTVRG